MITYGYCIKLANGPIIREEDRKPFTDCLQFMVNTELGPDIGTDSTMRFLVESVVPGYDKNGRITDVTIHADMPMSEEFYDRAGEMIADATDQAWYQISKDMSIEITAQGDLQVLGMEGDMPAKLYHITDRAGADSILKEGLLPKQGENSYRNDEDFVYLTDMEQLPVWMGILKDPDDMVLLEVDPAGVRNMERGRTFEDREYIDRFSEYRTREPVPAECVREARLTPDEQDRLHETALRYLKAGNKNMEEPLKTVRIMERMMADTFTEAVETIPDNDRQSKIEYRRQVRETMVSERYEQLAAHTDEVLAEKTDEYFRKNRTMPGEKAVKDIVRAQYEAMQYHKEYSPKTSWEWNQHVPDEYQIDRDELAHRMSEIVVKDVELHGDSRPHSVAENSRSFETLIAARTPDVMEKNVHVHAFLCDVSGTGKEQTYRFVNDTQDDFAIDTYAGPVPSGFSSNHPHMDGMHGVITAVDYSMGRHGNPNILFSIDLMQEPLEQALELNRGNEGDACDDFLAAVQKISNSDVLSL